MIIKYLNIMTILLHIGTGKTGSTYLQRQVYKRVSREQNVIYNPKILNILFELINPLNYKIHLENKKKIEQGFYENYKKELQQYFLDTKENILISHEGFSSLSYQINNKFILNLISYFLIDFEILLFLREHHEYLFSIYQEAFYNGNIVNYDDFLLFEEVSEKTAFNIVNNGITPSIDIRNVNYSKLIKNILNIKECRRLHLINYEDFKSNNFETIKKIWIKVFNPSDLLSISKSIKEATTKKSNVRNGISEAAIELILFLNKFISFERTILYSSSQTMKYRIDLKKNKFLYFLLKLPKSIRRIFTWKNLRLILVFAINKKIRRGFLKTKVINYLSIFSKSFKKDWENVHKTYNELFIKI